MSENTVDHILDEYRKLVSRKHARRVGAWPVLSGYHVKVGTIGELAVHIFTHTGVPGFVNTTTIGDIGDIGGVTTITASSLETVRANLSRYFRLGPEDAIVFLHAKSQGDGLYSVGWPTGEIERLLQQHESAMGLSPMKIFLSHKSADKSVLREFAKTLELMGFQPWLDEDAMAAGANLERALLEGFEQSCAVVFFVTENFADENYLATEIDYAIRQKRTKGEKFSIITLCFNQNATKITVPKMLLTYVYKEPASNLEAFREIIRALPIMVSNVRWR